MTREDRNLRQSIYIAMIAITAVLIWFFLNSSDRRKEQRRVDDPAKVEKLIEAQA